MPTKGRVLIVDDDIDILESLGDAIELQGFEVIRVSGGIEGLQHLRTLPFNLVLLDLQMPDMNGMDVLRQIEAEGIDTTVVVITAYGSVERAVAAMQAGAFDFIEKPFDKGRLRVVIDKAMEREHLRRDITLFREQAAEAAPSFICESPAMQAVLEIAQKAAQASTTLLLRGESGTGKEVLARAIHHWSDRRDRPFVAVNCVALPEHLLESELFGHEKGAFTGADRQKKGKFEMAHGGTMLLDEIGAMKPDAQVKLLRVLQEGAFERVGGEQTISTDVRVIAATNRDLEQGIVDRTFLHDLYYRLNVIAIELPPLRARKEDIPALTRFFLKRFAYEAKRSVTGISDPAMACLTAYDWPGNIRELENTIERAVVLSTAPEIRSKDLPARMPGRTIVPSPETTTTHVEEWLRAMIEKSQAAPGGNVLDTLEDMAIRVAIEYTQGNKSKAAELLGINRHRLAQRLMVKNDQKNPDWSNTTGRSG